MKMHRKNSVGFSLLIFMVLFFYASFVKAAPTKEIEVNTLVISSRNHTRMQPEIFYAFMASAKKIEPLLKMNFILFNPFQHEVVGEGLKFQKKLKAFMDLLNKCVAEVMAIKKAHPRTEELLKRIHNYIRKNPHSRLAELHAKIEELMRDFEFLIIESSDTYGVHPIFYEPDVTRDNTPEGASTKDVIETLYGLFFIDAAFKQNKPIWGACHGAQIGYIHAGGKLGRLFEYKAKGYDVDFKKTGQKHAEVETWHINKTLNTQEKDSDYIEWGMAVYPVPEIFKGKEKNGEEMCMNKDFEHSLGLVEPIPEVIEVISYHPLSEYKKKGCAETYRDDNEAFNKVLKSQVLVDAYKYKTMLGTQYHPQYTYNDLETSIVFDYLMRKLIEQMTDKNETKRK